jgi:transporter family protein
METGERHKSGEYGKIDKPIQKDGVLKPRFLYKVEAVMWIVYAFLSAFFAALTSILGKIGVENINSNLATAIRTIVVIVMAWAIVFITGKHNDLVNISHKNLLFLILSGITTGLSWLCYYRALQIGEASKVVPVDKFSVVIGMVLAFIILKETMTIKTIIGGILITTGTFVLIF